MENFQPILEYYVKNVENAYLKYLNSNIFPLSRRCDVNFLISWEYSYYRKSSYIIIGDYPTRRKKRKNGLQICPKFDEITLTCTQIFGKAQTKKSRQAAGLFLIKVEPF